MRKKAERQYPLDFAGTQKLTKEWYAEYREIDAILHANSAVVDLVHADLAQGLKKAKRNVEGVASETILRMAIVQQLEALSLRNLIVAIDDSEMLRFFCKFYDDALISHCQYAKLVNLIQPPTWEKTNEIIVRYGRDKKKIKGEKLRLDTTAVETDVHYPTDSSLLFDCIRTQARLIQAVREVARELVGDGRTHVKKAKRIAFELARGGAKLHKATQKCLYQRLLDQAEHLRQWRTRCISRL
jgi:IS5 family transposase